MKVIAALMHSGHRPQKALLRMWLSRLAVVGVLLVAGVVGWGGYVGSDAQAAIAGLWSLCVAGAR